MVLRVCREGGFTVTSNLSLQLLELIQTIFRLCYTIKKYKNFDILWNVKVCFPNKKPLACVSTEH